MEDVLGGRTSPERFAAFLHDWEAIQARRVTAAVSALAAIEGVRGLVLAGSLGRGEPWPLSDIDLLPVYDDDRVETARAEVERHRAELLPQWVDEGWWTGLDIGRLAFLTSEVDRVLGPGSPGVMERLDDDRWYHALDKGYRSRPVYDPSNLAGPLARWLTRHRFDPTVVEFRLVRARREVAAADRNVLANLDRQDLSGATSELRSAAKWLTAGVMEGWGARDASLGRVGTRFERLTRAHDCPELADALNELASLDPASVERRMASAPEWVRERHDRSWRARRHVGEELTPLQDARDTLRVCSSYAIRRITAPPFPAWLAIPSQTGPLREKSARLSEIIEGVSAGQFSATVT